MVRTGRKARKETRESMVAMSITMNTSPKGLEDLAAAVEMGEMSTTISITTEGLLPVTVLSGMGGMGGTAGMGETGVTIP